MHNSCYFSNIAHIFRMPFPKLEGQKLSGAGFLCRVVFLFPRLLRLQSRIFYGNLP